MAIVLFDNQYRKKLYPFTATKAVADLRLGIFTIKERWEKLTNQKVFIQTENYLQGLYEKISENDLLWVDATVLPDENLLSALFNLEVDSALVNDDGLIAIRKISKCENLFQSFKKATSIHIKRLDFAWQLFQWNDEWLRKDFLNIIQNRVSQKISSTNFIQSPQNIFIEEGAVVEYAFINANDGPVYIGKNAVVSEGAMIRGPFALLENALVKMGAKIVGATTIGPACTVCGEIKNSILFGYSNKGHDGYLGDSVIGEWCNVGAGTSNSNVKNSAGTIKMWNAFDKNFYEVGNKAGVLVGDYSRFSINSSINTGSFVGVACSIFGNGLLPKVMNDFTWGTSDEYEFDKAIRDISNWKKIKHQQLNDVEIDILRYIFAAKFPLV